MQKATQQQTKEHNRSIVLQTIFKHDSISRAEIARITHLTRTTVSDIVGTLLDEGLVSEVGLGESQGGKSPILLSLVEDSRYLIGLDLAQSELRGAIVNLRGKIQATVTVPVEDRSGDEALHAVYEILDHLVAFPHQPIVGIGVGAPGLVNASEGMVIRAVNLDWENVPLARLLGERYRLPVAVLNDSHAAAVGEFTYGEGYMTESNLVVVNARRGIGAGIIINGQLFPGDGGNAGEIGHIVVCHQDGLLCRCGNYGCLETVASARGLIRKVQLLGQQPSREVTLDSIQKTFAAGDPQVRKLVFETARYMGIGIASLVGTLNIHKILLSGDMTGFGEPWLNVIRETISHNSLDRLAASTEIEVGQLGKDGVLLGASAVLANNYSLLFNNHPEARLPYFSG